MLSNTLGKTRLPGTPKRVKIKLPSPPKRINSSISAAPSTPRFKIVEEEVVNPDGNLEEIGKGVKKLDRRDKCNLQFKCADEYDFLKDRNFWIFVAVSIIGIIISWLAGIASLDDKKYDSLHKPGYTPPPYVTYCVFFVFYLITGYIGYFGYVKSKTNGQLYANNFLFLVQIALITAWIILFFGDVKNIPAAFWVLITLFIIIIIWMLLLVNIDRTLAFVMLFFIAWLGFVIAFNWNIVVDNDFDKY